MTRPVRWGILGTGNINDRFLAHARETDRAVFAAVGSRTPERARVFADRHGIEQAHGSYEELLDDRAIEAVYINVPNSLHHPWTMAALAAGKHVLCEKPYTRHPDEVGTAFDAAEAAGLVLMEGFMWRHTPQARRVVELLSDIGDLQAIRATFSFGLDDPSDIRLRADFDGGSLMDVGTYCVSAARLLAGAEPMAVTGQQAVGPSGVDVRFAGTLRFPGDVVATILSGFTSDHATVEAIGSDGSIVLTSPFHGQASSIAVTGAGGERREVAVATADPYLLEVANFSAAVRGEESPLLGRADALGQARALEALYRSADTGVAVDL